MPDIITTTAEQSWFSRIGAAIKGVVIGGALFLVSFPLLFWNEGRAVKTYRALREGAGAVVEADAAAVSPAQEGKLVHVTGRASAAGALADEEFGVTAPGALRLRRKVEMYQWREKNDSKSEKNLGGSKTTTTTTTYEKTWSETRIDSASFKSAADHANPGEFPVAAKEFRAEVTLGARALTAAQVAEIPATTPVAAPSPDALKLPETLKAKATAAPGFVYLGKNAAAPEIGDVRVSFVGANATDISVLAAQTGATFAPYATSNGRTIAMVKVGVLPAATMFAEAEAANAGLTWALRVIGFLLMGFGLSMILRPLAVLADVLPFLGDLVEIGLGFIAFGAAAALSLVTIAVAWILYRPVLAVALLVIAGGAAYAILRRRAEKKLAAAAPEPAKA